MKEQGKIISRLIFSEVQRQLKFLNGKNGLPERSSLPSKNFPCISMDMLQIGALVLLGRPIESQTASFTKAKATKADVCEEELSFLLRVQLHM